MLTINWNDIKLNGMPAINRALETLAREFNALEIRNNLGIHQLEERMRRLEDSHDQLRAEQVSQQEIVEELGHGWRIERTLQAPVTHTPESSAPPIAETATPALTAQGANTTVEDIDRQFAAVASMMKAAQKVWG